MFALSDQVRQDAASLHRFVCNIADQCDQRSGAAAYLESSERFFTYVIALVGATKKYLQSTTESATSAPELLDLRKEVATLRAGWRFLHEFIKPVVDADTLRLPTALLQGLTKRLRELQEFNEVDFVVYHADEFNYLNVTVGVLKREADKIAKIVGGPLFPDSLGLTGIPYSQSSSLFMNCLIPHEMGHYVFGKSKLDIHFKRLIEQALKSTLGPSVDNKRLQLIELLAFWVEEVFCDSFAVRLVGPCFPLSFVELFDASVNLDEGGGYVAAPGATDFARYPPDLFRLRQQIVILRSDGWWNHIQTLKSHYIQTLIVVEGLDDKSFESQLLSANGYDAGLVLPAFISLMPELISKINAITADLSNCVTVWEEQRGRIQEYLEHGVVPSTLTRTDGKPPDIPNTVTLLNASLEFSIESLDDLLAKIKDANPNSVRDRAYWVKRVEMWTAKAIEDSILLDYKAS